MLELHQLLLRRAEELTNIIDTAGLCIKQAPNGTLRITKSKGTIQYYHRENKEDKAGKYIRKSNRNLANRLAQKDYAAKIIEHAIKERNDIVNYLNTYHLEDLSSIYYTLSKSRQELINPYIVDDETYITEWKKEKLRIKEELIGRMPYELIEDENSIITELEEQVRSKSEKILADKLYMMGIPYVYECPILLDGYGMVTPDLRVLNVRTRKEFIWEHLGMMDSDEYCEKAIKKIETYQKNNIYPGIDLILTYETQKHPLNTKIVEDLIKQFLL